AQADRPGPPPLTEAQRTRIARLANDTQKETARLRALLEARQKELARVYGEYELDEKRAAKLEAEILDLQRQMLASYRKLQIDLRTLIGKERFVILKKRLDNRLQSKEKGPNHRGTEAQRRKEEKKGD